MAPVIRPGLRLDCEPDAARRDNHRVDVPSSRPRNGMTHPPTLPPKRIENAPNLILRARADPAAPGQRKPAPSPETDRDRDAQEQHRGNASPVRHEMQPDNGGRCARQRQPARTRTAAVLMTTRTVHAAYECPTGRVPITRRSSQPPRTRLEPRAPGSSTCPTTFAACAWQRTFRSARGRPPRIRWGRSWIGRIPRSHMSPLANCEPWTGC